MMKNIRYVRFAEFAALSLLLIALLATVGRSAVPEPAVNTTQATSLAQPEDSRTLWTIDTRTASYCRGVPLDEAGVRVTRKVDGCWQDASRAELSAVDKKVPLIVFFHGMWLDRAGGREEGMRFYRLLERNSSDRPFQFVIWSWPAMRQQFAPRKDVRVKVLRTDTQAFYVAQWLKTLPKDRPICLVGYSLGARIVSGSLELLGGGTVCGQSLDGLATATDEVHVLAGPQKALGEMHGLKKGVHMVSDQVRVLKGIHMVSDQVRILKGPGETQAEVGAASAHRPLRVVLVAAAIDSGSFLPGHRNSLVLSQVERLLVTRNSKDRVLRWYPTLYRIGGPQAMGFAGPCSSRLGEAGDRLEVLPVTCSVGRTHYWMHYLRSCALRRELLEFALEPSLEVAPIE